MTQKPFRGMQINKSHQLARGLVGCWILNEATGDMCFDLSGNGNNITNGAGVLWEDNGLRYNGTTSSTRSAEEIQDLIRITDEYTVVMKYKIISRPAFTNTQLTMWHNPFILGRNGNVIISQFRQGGTVYTLSSGVSVSNGNTASVAFSSISGEQKIYVDGVSKASDNKTGLPSYGYSADVLSVGGTTDGIVYYVYIYNRSLTATEVAELNADPYQMFKRAINPALFYYESIGGMNIPIFINHYTQQMRV